MDCTTDILEVWKELTLLNVNNIKQINNGLEEQTLRLDIVYNKLLQSAQNELPDYLPEKKISKRQSKATSGQVGDLFSTESSFQQPAVPPVRRTKRQASIVALDKIKSKRESATIASGGSIRASRTRALYTLEDIVPIDNPKANSTFVVNKKLIENIEECLSPDIFPLDNETYIKPKNPNKTYDMPSTRASKKLNINVNLIPKESPINVKASSVSSANVSIKEKSENSELKNKRREKLEDIDVNISEQSAQHMTRTMKRKIQNENQINAKKTNVVHVLLEKKISTPVKPLEDLAGIHQARENNAEKRKEMYLKSKADQKKIDEQHLKAAKQREEQIKRAGEKRKKVAEERKRKEEAQKEKELMLKEEALKKQKQIELRLLELNTKRKQADEAKKLKMEQEIKKKYELPEKSKSVRPKAIISNLPTPSVPKVVTVSKSKVVKNEINKNDYGLNDISARDSSEDESGPKKPVPNWAKRENRKAVLELQYHVDSKVRDLFFNCPKNMSLKEMFKGWNIRDKQRTSSAVWNTPPRYSEYIRKN